MNRYSDIKNGDNKSCPCGSGSTNRRCARPAEFSDPDRSTDRITTYAPGDTITVRFDEYVAHSGRYRIAFDPDGAELDDFNAHILLDEPDPVGKVGNAGSGSMWEFQVTLPDMTCENCSLQLIQVMDGNMEDLVLNPVDRGGTYFQCADVRLVAGTPAGGIAPSAPSDHPGTRGRNELSAALEAAAAADANMAASPDGAAGGTSAMGDGADTTPMMGSDSDAGSGCSLVAGPLVGSERARRSGPVLGLFSSLLLAAGLGARRRRR
ncbi:MAG: hypothetical protein RL033_8059 [Pseudomonadota bacterium]|jgi:hypothetical protein